MLFMFYHKVTLINIYFKKKYYFNVTRHSIYTDIISIICLLYEKNNIVKVCFNFFRRNHLKTNRGIYKSLTTPLNFIFLLFLYRIHISITVPSLLLFQL